MTAPARELAVREFDVRHQIERTLTVYGEASARCLATSARA